MYVRMYVIIIIIQTFVRRTLCVYVKVTLTLTGRVQQLQQTITSLTDSLTEKQSTIDALKLQVVIYRQDFEAERQDREHAHSRIVELQTQLNELLSHQRASTNVAPAAAAPAQVH